MTSAQFKLDMFEGPLDLLLHLISKHKLNIYDIEITLLLEQYLEYMDSLDHEDYEDAADFLEMAARLIYIKTVSLLPQDNEGEELKKELEGRIIEYSLCKLAAARLKESYVGGEVFVREPVKLPVNKTFTGEKDPEELLLAYLGMNEKTRNSKPLRADMFQPIVSQKIVSVTSKIIFILKKLYTTGSFEMDRLYDGMTVKSERVATFLAVLELTKSGRIFLNEDNSMVYMNSAAKKGRLTSDFDKQEEESRNNSQIAADNDNAESPQDSSVHEVTEVTDGGMVFYEQGDNEDIPQTDDDMADIPPQPDDTEAEQPAVSLEEIAEQETEKIGQRHEYQRESVTRHNTYRAESVKHSEVLALQSDTLEALEQIAVKIDRLPVTAAYDDKGLSLTDSAGSAAGVALLEREAPTETEDKPDEAVNTQAAPDEKMPDEGFKPNYFAVRYYWGSFPAQGSCWRYGMRRY